MSVPVISVDSMRALESASWAAGAVESDVIDRVGAALALRIRDFVPKGERIVILAGHGHNGDDARAAALHLPDRPVTLVNIQDPSDALAEVSRALQPAPALVLDGLFGIGLNRPLEGAWADLIQLVNTSGAPIAAIDVPSGLDARTGSPLGAALRAHITWTVAAPKSGLLRPDAIPFVGRLEVLKDVGLLPLMIAGDALSGIGGRPEAFWTEASDFDGFPPARAVSGHKGDHGHVTIWAGSMGYHGAAVLAARGAQRAQPGLVSVITQPEVYAPVAAQLQAPMVHAWHAALELPSKTTAIVFGPGLAAPEARERLHERFVDLWRHFPGPVVVDASALDWLPADFEPASGMRVLTPHPGEAARLLGCDVATVQKDRFWAQQVLSERFGGCWVILKGHQTVLGNATGIPWVNSSGNPHLGQGGAGDVLAGLIGGLLAQKPLQERTFQAIRWAVWRHGHAADRLQQENSGRWTIEDLVEAL